MVPRYRIRPLALLVALGAMLTIFALPLTQPLAPRAAGAAEPTATPTATVAEPSFTPVAAEPTEGLLPNTPVPDLPGQAEVGVAGEVSAEAEIAALLARLEAMPREEQARLAEAAALASELAPVERQVEVALPDEVGVQDVVLLYRLFVPMVTRVDAPPPPTPTATATSRPATPTPTRTPRPDDDDNGQAADVSVTLRARPSVRVARGALLAYDIELTNYGSGDAGRTVVRLNYNRNLVAVSHSELNRRDWVSDIEDRYVEISFGELDGKRSRTGTIYFRVKSNVADNSVIDGRASVSWEDSDSGGSMTTNWAPVLVGGGNEHSDWAWLQVTPESGSAGTTFRFFTDRFIPGEEVVFWLNTPDGVKALDLREDADRYGRVWADIGTRNYKPGWYSLVARGMRSEVEAVRAFQIR
jgi:hypothetical protein